MSSLLRRIAALLALGALLAPAAFAASGDTAALRAHLLAAYANVKSYKITVLGSVKSSGVYVAPNRYKMTTQFEGKTVKTIFIGGTYWIFANGHWEKQTSGNNLDYDVSGLIRNLQAGATSALTKRPDVVRNGKRLGTFAYTFKSSGTQEVCNYDTATYQVVRCKAEELTILYSGYNDPTNVVPNPK
jgi:outer membrane lipoprotein-sorting protein